MTSYEEISLASSEKTEPVILKAPTRAVLI